MKKILALILAALMCFSMVAFASCNGNDDDDDDKPGADKVQIGVQTGTTGQYYVNGDVDWDFPGIDGYEAKGYDNGGLAIQALLNGNVKYVIIDEQPAKQLAKVNAGVKVINVPLTVEEYAFGVDKAQPELRTQINDIITEIKNNGKLDEIVTAYATGAARPPIESAEYDASKNQFVVATNAAFAPFEYKEGNNYLGIDMEIAKYIADVLGMELVIKDMDFNSVVTSVGINGVDVAMAGLTVNAKRQESVDFTDSYYNAAQMLIVPAANTAFDNCTNAAEVLAVLKSELGE